MANSGSRSPGVPGDTRDIPAECGPHVLHLVEATAELLAECHRYRLYLAVCGAELPTETMLSSSCEPECERMITYCQKCVRDVATHNADAGLDSPASGVGR